MILRVQRAECADAPSARPTSGWWRQLGIVFCGCMMASLPNDTWLRLVIWTAIGLAIYFAYGVRHAAPSKWKVANEA